MTFCCQADAPVQLELPVYCTRSAASIIESDHAKTCKVKCKSCPRSHINIPHHQTHKPPSRKALPFVPPGDCRVRCRVQMCLMMVHRSCPFSAASALETCDPASFRSCPLPHHRCRPPKQRKLPRATFPGVSSRQNSWGSDPGATPRRHRCAQVPGPRRRPERLHGARHPSHEGCRITLPGGWGCPAIRRLAP